jgi:hypothetical protein
VQHCRRLAFDLSNIATFFAPDPIHIASGLQGPKALIGAPDHEWQQLQ